MKSILTILLFSLITFSCTDKSKEKTLPVKKISDWARPGTKGQMSGAYFVYKNSLSIADTLLKVDSPQAKMSQVHESYITEDGLSGMREMTNIIVQPDETLLLEQGGLHVMLMNLNEDLSSIDSVTIKLTFSQAGIIEMKLPVKQSN